MESVSVESETRRGIRVAIVGTGRIGSEVIRACMWDPTIDVVAAVVTSSAKDGRDIGEIVGLPPMGIKATTDVESVLRRQDVDLVFYCGLGDPLEVAEYIGRIARHGKDVVTLTGLIHPVAALGKDAAAHLERLAVQGGARIVGAGWNPGFLLDVLPVMWGSSCVRIDSVYALRVAEMRDWGPGVHEECGIDLLPEDVHDTDSNPLHESVALISEGLRIPLDSIKNVHEPFVTSILREHAGLQVSPGRNAGFHKRSQGIVGGKVKIEIEMYGIFCITPTVDNLREGAKVVIDGESRIEAEVSGSWFGDSYPVTAAKAIRAVPPLRQLRPGLYRPDELALSARL